MKLETVLCLGVFGVMGAAQADTLSRVITPPYYTDTARLQDGTAYYFHDDQWAAVVFLRLPSCVPVDFDLLDGADFAPAFPNGPPRVFGCALTVDGQAIFQSPNDFVPVQANLKGLGAVPVWFVKLTDIQAVLAGNKLTIMQLAAIPSLRKASPTCTMRSISPASSGLRDKATARSTLPPAVLSRTGPLSNSSGTIWERRTATVRISCGTSALLSNRGGAEQVHATQEQISAQGDRAAAMFNGS